MIMRVPASWLLCFVFVGIHWLIPPASARDQSSWVRGGVSAAKFVPNVDPHESFDLQVIRSENGSLTVMAVITRKISEKESHYPAIDVEGVERNGAFWPSVRSEVSDDLDEG